MKLGVRMTKGRVACAVILAPMLYVLNVGPMVYCVERFGVGHKVVLFLYAPLGKLVRNTRFEDPFFLYMDWWGTLPPHRLP